MLDLGIIYIYIYSNEETCRYILAFEKNIHIPWIQETKKKKVNKSCLTIGQANLIQKTFYPCPFFQITLEPGVDTGSSDLSQTVQPMPAWKTDIERWWWWLHDPIFFFLRWSYEVRGRFGYYFYPCLVWQFHYKRMIYI